MEEEIHSLHQQVMSNVVSVNITIATSLPHTSTGQKSGGGEGTITLQGRASRPEDQGDRDGEL